MRLMIPTAMLLSMLTTAVPSTAAPPLSQPAISPDGTTIAFVSGGDIWSVAAGGGDARLLVSHPADESRPLFSPDGSRLAFESTRTGNGDIYVLHLESGRVDRVTWDDATENLDGWSADGSAIYFSSFVHEIAGMNDLFRIPAGGGTAMPVAATPYLNEHSASIAPDGRRMAFVGHGIGSAHWWRNGHSHIDTSEIWLRDLVTAETRQLTTEGAKQLWPMWGGDGSLLFFMSDRSGSENLWRADLDGKTAPVTKFESGRFLWPSITRDGRVIAFERDFGIWIVETSTGTPRRLDVRLRAARSGPGTEVRTLSDSIDEIAVSPDGKKIAFIVHGEVFAASAKDGGDAYRVTRSTAPEFDLSWAPDSRRLLYASERGEGTGLHLYDFGDEHETTLVTDARPLAHPTFSPDGSRVAFLRDARELHVMPASGGVSRKIAEGAIDLLRPLSSIRPLAWSPDGSKIAFMSFGDRLFRNASVVPVDGSGSAMAVSFVGNVYNETVSWSPDGRSLYFDTGQRTEPGQIARVDLVPQVPRFREAEFRDLFREEMPKSVPPADQAAAAASRTKSDTATKTEPKTEIDLTEIRRRLEILPIELDVEQQRISPDGKTLLIVATSGGKENLYSFTLDELSKDAGTVRQLTSSAGRKSDPEFSADGKEIWFLHDGKIHRIPADGGDAKPLAVRAAMEIDFERERDHSFSQAWRWMRDHFHDREMHGADWKAIRDRWAPMVGETTTAGEFQRLLNLMVGELNASHLGARPAGRAERTTGRIGLRFDREEYERNGRFRISRVIPLSPAAVTRQVREGDWLVAINGQPLDAKTDLARLLDRTVDRELRLRVSSAADGRGAREVTVRPVNLGTEKQLIYRDWVEENRARVARLSGGRLGYVHMPDMSWDSYVGLIRDLDAENQTRDGVVIDIRNNNGGFVNAYALDVFSRRHYLGMRFRGLDTVSPARTILGQRSVERPTILVTNRHSLSDAEDFTEGYRSLGLGKVVGEPTAGWIIYTSNVSLLDGTIFRLPFITVFTVDGVDMETEPRPVDILVRRPVGSEGDPQLDRAVRELLREIAP